MSTTSTLSWPRLRNEPRTRSCPAGDPVGRTGRPSYPGLTGEPVYPSEPGCTEATGCSGEPGLSVRRSLLFFGFSSHRMPC